MIGFFRNFNLARAIILFSLLGSCYLGWINYSEYVEVKDLRLVFDHQVAKVCGEIQEKAKLHSKLITRVKGDGFLGEDNPDTYIRTIADSTSLNMGQVSTRTTERQRASQRNVTDKITTIEPSDNKKEFDHYKIARFLYELERGSGQIKVTMIDLKLQGKRPQEGEIPLDKWTFTAEVTNRVKKEE